MLLYKEKITIDSSLVDPQRRLRPSALLELLQNASIRSYRALVPSDDAFNDGSLLWIIAGLRVKIDRLPVQHEEIEVVTYPQKTVHIIYPRQYVFTSLADGQVLVRAAATWLVLDARTRRPSSPKESGVIVPGLEEKKALPISISIPRKKTVPVMTRHVYPSDIDLNGHLNNVRYVAWLFDVFSSAWLSTHPLKEILIRYRREAGEGEDITISRSSDAPYYFAFHSASGELIAEAELVLAE